MRILIAAMLLAACGQPAPPAPARGESPPPTFIDAAPIWFICDGVDAPVLFLFADGPEDGRVRLVRFDKPSGASAGAVEVALGEAEGAAGSLITPLLIDAAEIGAVRQINPGMLETPGAAYTPPFASVRFRETETQCRWLPRTRLMAFTGRRSIVVHEDADGDLIYSSFNFDDANAQAPIELSENAQTTQFSAEVRGGEEALSPSGATFSFAAADGYQYVVEANRDGTGRLAVMRAGELVQEEPLTAFQLGEAR
jgi:hypothetical protein